MPRRCHDVCMSVLLLTMLAACTQPLELVFREPVHATTHDAIVHMPEQARSTGVLLIGGGMAHDEHWTVPGSHEHDGVVTTFTIDGKPKRDADALASALADAGFVVMQYSSIRTDDPLHAKDPAMASPMGYEQSVEVARAALKTLRSQGGVKRVILIGHSLGATRACHIADDDVIGLGFLAGAYLSRTAARTSDVAQQALDAHAGHDGVLAAEQAAQLDVESIDRDGDGLLRGWEVAAFERDQAISETGVDPLGEPDREHFRAALPWAWDVLREGDVPVLAIFGGLDTISLHGPMLETIDAEVVYLADRGHQLSVEEDGLVGPMDEQVVQRVVTWATTVAGEADVP